MIYVPAVASKLHPRTVPAILEAGRIAEVWPMEHPHHYGYAFALWWEKAEHEPLGFTVVEHDVEVGPTILADFDACPEPWCCSPYNDHALLGCTRWRPGNMRDDAGLRSHSVPETARGTRWDNLDMRVYDELTRAGFRPHEHERQAVHHHGWTTEKGCKCGKTTCLQRGERT